MNDPTIRATTGAGSGAPTSTRSVQRGKLQSHSIWPGRLRGFVGLSGLAALVLGTVGLVLQAYSPTGQGPYPEVGKWGEIAAVIGGGVPLLGVLGYTGYQRFFATPEALKQFQQQHKKLLKEAEAERNRPDKSAAELTAAALIEFSKTPLEVLKQLNTFRALKYQAEPGVMEEVEKLRDRYYELVSNERLQLLLRFQAVASNEDAWKMDSYLRDTSRDRPEILADMKQLVEKQTGGKALWKQFEPYLPYMRLGAVPRDRVDLYG